MIAVEIRHGRTLPPPEDPSQDQTPQTCDGIYVEGSFNGWMSPAEAYDLGWAFIHAADAMSPPPPKAEEPKEEKPSKPAAKKK